MLSAFALPADLSSDGVVGNGLGVPSLAAAESEVRPLLVANACVFLSLHAYAALSLWPPTAGAYAGCCVGLAHRDCIRAAQVWSCYKPCAARATRPAGVHVRSNEQRRPHRPAAVASYTDARLRGCEKNAWPRHDASSRCPVYRATSSALITADKVDQDRLLTTVHQLQKFIGCRRVL